MDITVVICLYNAENYIIETLQSLERQTNNNFKLLIINDCSTDNSIKIVEGHLPVSNFTKYEIVNLKENKGTAYVRNFALTKVDTPLMMFFDSDDLAKPTMVKELEKEISHNENCIVVSCYSSYMDSNGKKIIGGHYLGPISQDEFYHKAKNGKFILMPGIALFKREEAIRVGGYNQKGFPVDSKIRYQDLSEDLDLWARMSDLYTEDKYMITIPEVLFYYRKNTNTLSASKDSLIAMQNKIRYIKHNLKRRRKNLPNKTFIDFMDSIDEKDKQKFYKKDMSAYYYREAGFNYVNKKYLKFLWNMILSIKNNPAYIADKMKSNFLK